MFPESDLLPISALQHLLFCERQCALIHLEGLWAENRLTVEGGHLHRRAHEGPDETRPGVRTVRGLELRSLHLGLIGQADVVEFHTDTDRNGETGAAGTSNEPAVFPVEYKRGKPKSDRSDQVQLCAQALCLEEMLETDIPAGALYYGRQRRRTDVAFDDELRRFTRETVDRLHELIGSGLTPRVPRQPKCDRCSLLHLCLPEATGPKRSARRYLGRSLAKAAEKAP